MIGFFRWIARIAGRSDPERVARVKVVKYLRRDPSRPNAPAHGHRGVLLMQNGDTRCAVLVSITDRHNRFVFVREENENEWPYQVVCTNDLNDDSFCRLIGDHDLLWVDWDESDLGIW